jgi:hypothetical protein
LTAITTSRPPGPWLDEAGLPLARRGQRRTLETRRAHACLAGAVAVAASRAWHARHGGSVPERGLAVWLAAGAT